MGKIDYFVKDRKKVHSKEYYKNSSEELRLVSIVS